MNKSFVFELLCQIVKEISIRLTLIRSDKENNDINRQSYRWNYFIDFHILDDDNGEHLIKYQVKSIYKLFLYHPDSH